MYKYLYKFTNKVLTKNIINSVNNNITNKFRIHSPGGFIWIHKINFTTKENRNKEENLSISDNIDFLAMEKKENSLEPNTNNVENNLNSKLDKDLYTQKLEKANELFKYINIRFHILKIEEAIQILQICTNFRCYPAELIPKLEKSLTKVITNMNELQLTKTIYGFAMLNYHTRNLNFFYERSLTKHIASFSQKNFNTILKSLVRIKYSSTGLISIIRNYISKNLNKFSLYESCDVFCNFIKLIKIEDDEDKILMKKLFDQIYPHFNKLDTTRLINFYFVITSKKSKEISSLIELIKNEIKISEDFYVLLNNRKNEINHKLYYLIILSSHFVEKFYENDMKLLTNKHIDLFYELFEKNLNYFTPDEINTIITIFINNKETFNFDNEKMKKLFHEFRIVSDNEMADMNMDEILLYLQSLLMIQIEYGINDLYTEEKILLKETLKNFREEIFNKRINSFKLNHFTSLIELIHHFKPNDLCEEIRVYRDSMDLIVDKFMSCIDIQTNTDFKNIFDDYYLIGRFLIDLNYKENKFWKKYFKFLEFFELMETESKNEFNLQKIKMLKEAKNKQIENV